MKIKRLRDNNCIGFLGKCPQKVNHINALLHFSRKTKQNYTFKLNMIFIFNSKLRDDQSLTFFIWMFNKEYYPDIHLKNIYNIWIRVYTKVIVWMLMFWIRHYLRYQINIETNHLDYWRHYWECSGKLSSMKNIISFYLGK